MFDLLLLISEGKLMYFGPAPAAVRSSSTLYLILIPIPRADNLLGSLLDYHCHRPYCTCHKVLQMSGSHGADRPYHTQW